MVVGQKGVCVSQGDVVGHDLSSPRLETVYFRVKMSAKHCNADDLFPIIWEPALTELLHELFEGQCYVRVKRVA